MSTGPMSEVIQQLHRALLSDGAALSDGQLLDDYLSRRDEAALAALVRRHGPMVWGVCRRVLRNEADAEDAFQATFLVLVRKATSIASRELLANWLYGVAHQTALKARSTAAKRGARERQVTDMPEPAVTDPELGGDLQPLLDQELSRLPDIYRVAIVLCELEGKTRTEAARQLGVPEGTLAARVARGRAMLARRLARHGLTVSAGSLAALLSQNTASAGVPAAVVSSTINAASQFAAGSAAGAISARVVALTEGVLKAMLISKLKAAATVLLLVVLAGVGAGALTIRALAQKPDGAEPPVQRAEPASTEGLTTVAAPVVKVSPDGKTITLEMPAEARGEEPKRVDIRITDKTEVVYNGVGLNAAKPAEGQHAHVWLKAGSTDTAAKVTLSVLDVTRQGRSFISGAVVAVSQDGKRITMESPQGRGLEPTKTEITLSDKTKVTYAYAAKDAAKPTVGYQADVWLEEEGTCVAKVHFVDVAREKDALLVGKVVGLGKDGNGITLEVPAAVRGEEPAKAEVKIVPGTEIIFQGVGSGEAKLMEGYGARVWLQDGSTDTAAKIVLSKGGERGR
jgi:RNA polymerase sigma factor (sigma-70 family)